MPSNYPKLGTFDLLQGQTGSSIGAAFELARPAKRDIRWSKDGWDILVDAQCSWMMVRGPAGPRQFEDVLESCAENAQKGLDLVSAQIGAHLIVSNFENEQLVWWSTSEGVIVRQVSIGSTTFDASASISVGDGRGNVIPPTPDSGPRWHESFRYYRLSQATTDLFDSYRNGYLALESILSDIAPQRVKQSGAIAEGESQWFRRALAESDARYGLMQWVPKVVADPVQQLYQDLYVGTRSAVSHAKSGRRVLLPQNAAERREVTSSLNQLMALYQGLATSHFGVSWPGGSLATRAAAASISAIFNGLDMYLSDDESPFSESETSPNPAGGMLVGMTADAEPNVQGNSGTRQWSIDTATLAPLSFVRRIVGLHQGSAASVSLLPDRLYVPGIHRLEVVLGVRILSARSPRSGFAY
jgi:hypothetical protein